MQLDFKYILYTMHATKRFNLSYWGWGYCECEEGMGKARIWELKEWCAS